jgi:hypothetical protein
MMIYDNLMVKVERTRVTDNGVQTDERQFQTLQEAYQWALRDARIVLPVEQKPVYEIENWEVCSFNFTRDMLNRNVRREGFEFGVEAVSSDFCEYALYYVEPVVQG